MEPRFTTPANRLAWRVGDKGVSRPEAVKQARENLQSIKQDGIAAIDKSLDQLDQLFNAPDLSSEATLQALYEHSDAIASVAALFDFEPMGRAAYSLCELLSGFGASTVFSHSAIKAHLGALHVLRQQSSAARDQSDLLLAHLKDLVDHLEAR